MSEECRHFWTAEVNEDGSIAYRANRHMWRGLRVHVTCSECNSRKFMTKEKWEALPAFDAPDRQGHEQ